MNDSDEFWRKNVRPEASFGKWGRASTIWQRFYDWLTGHIPK